MRARLGVAWYAQHERGEHAVAACRALVITWGAMAIAWFVTCVASCLLRSNFIARRNSHWNRAGSLRMLCVPNANLQRVGDSLSSSATTQLPNIELYS